MPIPGNLLSATTEMVDPNTSGWTPKLNCTLGLGTGGRNGDGCLAARSIVGGEIQARTASSYPVTPGATYQTFADASGPSTERIGIRWLTAGGLEVGVTWSLVTATASASWHRVSVAGTAPSQATKAQVVLSSTESVALIVHYWENIYLGPPIRTLGNLFGFGTESTEIDASGWTPLVNAAVTRTVPNLAWPATSYTVGGHALTMTAVAPGNAASATVERPTVTPGSEYLAYAYLSPPTLSSTAWIELRFYDANGNQIAAQRSILAAPGTGMYRQRVSATAPGNAATASIAVGLDGASAGQVLRVDTAVLTAAPSLQAGNVLPYADTSFEQGIAGWTTASGAATLARTTPWGGVAADGSYALAITSTTATASVIRSGRYLLTGNSAGQNWRGQIYTHIGAGTWGPVGVRIRWYDGGNADLGTTPAFSYALSGTGWYVLYVEAGPPSNATQGAVEVTVTATATNAVLHVDMVTLWPVLPLATVDAHSSDAYIALTLRELPAGNTISVYRQMEDGTRALVRGPLGLIDRQAITSDLMVVEDHEAPLNTAVSYYVEFTSSTGLLTSRWSAQVALTQRDANLAWLKDPGNPQRNVQVTVQTAPDWQRPIEQTAYIVRGRRNKVILSGSRQGLEGDLSIWTRTDEDRKALHLLLNSGNVLLWQALPGMGVDDMYVNVGSITEGRIAQLAQEQWRTWTLPMIEADKPIALGVNGSGGRTWQDVVAEFATCANLLPVYATSEALLLERRTG
jgi:hypothetical protein